MEVHAERALCLHLEELEAPHRDVLADGGDLLGDDVFHFLPVAPGLLEERGDVGGGALGDVLHQALRQLDELIVLRDEVGLGVDLDHGPQLGIVGQLDAHQALGRDA